MCVGVCWDYDVGCGVRCGVWLWFGVVGLLVAIDVGKRQGMGCAYGYGVGCGYGYGVCLWVWVLV